VQAPRAPRRRRKTARADRRRDGRRMGECVDGIKGLPFQRGKAAGGLETAPHIRDYTPSD
jgi:hypothetical protein